MNCLHIWFIVSLSPLECTLHKGRDLLSVLLTATSPLPRTNVAWCTTDIQKYFLIECKAGSVSQTNNLKCSFIKEAFSCYPLGTGKHLCYNDLDRIVPHLLELRILSLVVMGKASYWEILTHLSLWIKITYQHKSFHLKYVNLFLAFWNRHYIFQN